MNMQSVLAYMAPRHPPVEIADPYLYELWWRPNRKTRPVLLRNVRDLDEAKQIVRSAMPNQPFWVLVVGAFDQKVWMEFFLRPRLGQEPELKCMGATIRFFDAKDLGVAQP